MAAEFELVEFWLLVVAAEFAVLDVSVAAVVEELGLVYTELLVVELLAVAGTAEVEVEYAVSARAVSVDDRDV